MSEPTISTLTQHQKGSKKFVITIEFEHEKLQLQKNLNEKGTKIEKDDDFEDTPKRKVTKLEDQMDTREKKHVFTKDIMGQEIQDVEKYVHMSPPQKRKKKNIMLK